MVRDKLVRGRVECIWLETAGSGKAWWCCFWSNFFLANEGTDPEPEVRRAGGMIMVDMLNNSQEGGSGLRVHTSLITVGPRR